MIIKLSPDVGWNVFGFIFTTFICIKGKFSILMDRVGLQRNNTEDLACTLLPLPIDTIYEVTWESVGVHDAKFELVYTGGAFV